MNTYILHNLHGAGWGARRRANALSNVSITIHNTQIQ